MWYTRSEVQKRFTVFSSAASIAAAFGGLLASAIGKMEGVGGYSAWRWIFILEDILTCALSTVIFFGLSDFPENSKWLTDRERLFVEKKLNADQGDSSFQQKLEWKSLVEAFKDWQMYPAALMYFGAELNAYGQHRDPSMLLIPISSNRTCIFRSINCILLRLLPHRVSASLRRSLGRRGWTRSDASLPLGPHPKTLSLHRARYTNSNHRQRASPQNPLYF